MNGFQFKTENGSTYEIDRDAMTWKRVTKTDASGTIRADMGHLIAPPVVLIGQAATLQDDAIRPGYDAHIVHTSRVLSISEIIT